MSLYEHLFLVDGRCGLRVLHPEESSGPEEAHAGNRGHKRNLLLQSRGPREMPIFRECCFIYCLIFLADSSLLNLTVGVDF